MATWQFDLHFLPITRLKEIFGLVPSCIPEEQFGSFPWWSDIDPSFLEAEVGRILPKGKSDLRHVQLWGTYDGDRIELTEDEGRYVEIYARIDLRDVRPETIASFVRLAQRLEAVLVTTGLEVIEPDITQLIEAIKSSNAYRFVSDPKCFFEHLKKNPIEWVDDSDAI